MIQTTAALADLAARIAGADRVGVDTEADSLHCYQEKVCLVQVGLPGADELADPLAGLDLTPLLEALAGTEMVMHGADFAWGIARATALGWTHRLVTTTYDRRWADRRGFSYVLRRRSVQSTLGTPAPRPAKANWARAPAFPDLARYRAHNTNSPSGEKLDEPAGAGRLA